MQQHRLKKCHRTNPRAPHHSRTTDCPVRAGRREVKSEREGQRKHANTSRHPLTVVWETNRWMFKPRMTHSGTSKVLSEDVSAGPYLARQKGTRPTNFSEAQGGRTILETQMNVCVSGEKFGAGRFDSVQRPRLCCSMQAWGDEQLEQCATDVSVWNMCHFVKRIIHNPL